MAALPIAATMAAMTPGAVHSAGSIHAGNSHLFVSDTSAGVKKRIAKKRVVERTVVVERRTARKPVVIVRPAARKRVVVRAPAVKTTGVIITTAGRSCRTATVYKPFGGH